MSLEARQEFEAWLQEVHLLDATWNEERNCYDEFPAHLAFKAWCAAKDGWEVPKSPVKDFDGKIKQFLLKNNGKRFYCHCHCNVFHKPDAKALNLYECNACGEQYEGF
jgi:hypothetical protein